MGWGPIGTCGEVLGLICRPDESPVGLARGPGEDVGSGLASIAGFKLQLADLNEDLLAVEEVAMRRAVPSVGQTFQQEDLWQLKDT